MDNTFDYSGTGQQFQEPPHPEVAKEDSRTHSSNGVSKIAHLLFISALFLLPFIFIPIPGWSVTVGKVLVTTILALSAGAAVFSTLFSKENLVLPRTYTLILLGMLVMVILSTVFSESVTASFFGSGLEVGTFVTTAIAIMIALVAPLVLNSGKRIAMALAALFLGGAVLGLFQFLLLFPGLRSSLSFGYFASPTSTPAGSWNDLGIFFGVLYLISLVSLGFGALPNRIKRMLVLALCVSLAFITLVNFQLLSFVLAFITLLLLVSAFLARKNNAILPASLALVFLLLIGGLSGANGLLSKLLGNTLNVSYAEVRPNWSSTTDMLGAGLSNIKNVVLGSGPNTFTYLWQANRVPDVINSNFWSIDFAFGAGIIPTFAITFGLITTIIMLVFAGYIGLKTYISSREDGTSSPFNTIAFATGLAALFLWLLAILYVFSAMTFLLMLILSGISIAALMRHGDIRTLTLVGSKQTGMLAGIVGVIVCIAFILPVLVVGTSRTIYGQGVIQANTAKDMEGVAAAQHKIRQASILEHNDAFARTETELSILRIQEFLSRKDTDESDLPALRQLVQETQESAERARRTNPRNYFNSVNSGLVYETLGLLQVENGFETAAKRYAEARSLNPTNPELILIQARLERARKDEAKAKEYAEQAIALKENYIDAYLLLADIELASKNTAGAITEIKTAIEKNPGNTFLLYQLGLVYYSDKDYTKAIDQFTKAIIIDSSYANARYFRGLSFIYGKNDKAKALKDLESISEQNSENETLAAVIANIKAGKDPLDGIADETPVISPTEDGVVPDSNVEAAKVLDNERKPESGAGSGVQGTTTIPPSTQGNTQDTGEPTNPPAENPAQ